MESLFHSVTTQTQTVVTIYYHGIIFLLPFNGGSMCNSSFASKLKENAVILCCHFSLILLEGEVTYPYCQGPAWTLYSNKICVEYALLINDCIYYLKHFHSKNGLFCQSARGRIFWIKELILKQDIICRLLIFFQNQLFWKPISGIQSECQTVRIRIRSDILSGLIWIQTVCKGFSRRLIFISKSKSNSKNSFRNTIRVSTS